MNHTIAKRNSEKNPNVMSLYEETYFMILVGILPKLYRLLLTRWRCKFWWIQSLAWTAFLANVNNDCPSSITNQHALIATELNVYERVMNNAVVKVTEPPKIAQCIYTHNRVYICMYIYDIYICITFDQRQCMVRGLIGHAAKKWCTYDNDIFSAIIWNETVYNNARICRPNVKNIVLHRQIRRLLRRYMSVLQLFYWFCSMLLLFYVHTQALFHINNIMTTNNTLYIPHYNPYCSLAVT